MSMKDRILFIGVGQAGGNIANQLEKRGFYTTYINTSSEDLSTLDTETKNKYHIPMTSGCSKNKSKARLYVKKYFDGMLNHIDTNFPNQDIVFLVFSSAGGTGAGMAPPILDVLSENNPNKSYGAVMVLPSLEEPNKCIKNGVDTYAEMTSIPGMKSMFILDNNKDDKLVLNSRFATYFDKLISAGNPDVRGNIDKDELETLLTQKGVSVILPVDEDAKGELTFKENLFVDYVKGCSLVGIACTDVSVQREIEELVNESVGYPDDVFAGYTDKTNLVVVTGMNYPDRMLEDYEIVVNERESSQRGAREGAVRIKSSFVNKEELSNNPVGFKVKKEKSEDVRQSNAKKISKWL